MYVTDFNIHFRKNDKANLEKCKLLFIPGSGYMSSLYYSTFVRKIFIIKKFKSILIKVKKKNTTIKNNLGLNPYLVSKLWIKQHTDRK